MVMQDIRRSRQKDGQNNGVNDPDHRHTHEDPDWDEHNLQCSDAMKQLCTNVYGKNLRH